MPDLSPMEPRLVILVVCLPHELPVDICQAVDKANASGVRNLCDVSRDAACAASLERLTRRSWYSVTANPAADTKRPARPRTSPTRSRIQLRWAVVRSPGVRPNTRRAASSCRPAERLPPSQPLHSDNSHRLFGPEIGLGPGKYD